MSAWSEAVWLLKKVKASFSSNNKNIDDILTELNDDDYGLEALADLVVKKNVVMTTNSGTSAQPVPQGVLPEDVVNGAMFFIVSS